MENIYIILVILSLLSVVLFGLDCYLSYCVFKNASNNGSLKKISKELTAENIFLKTNNQDLRQECDNLKVKITDLQNLENSTEKTLNQRKKLAQIEYDNYYKDVVKNYNSRTEVVAKQMNSLKAQLNSLKQIRDSIIKIEMDKDKDENFYKLNLSQEAIQDIQLVNSFAPKMNNSLIINKVIWSTYYLSAYNELITRVLGKQQKSGIYKITNVKNNKCYIGQSTNIQKRWADHLKTSLGIDACAKQKIHLALHDNIEDFQFELIEECDKNELNNRERFYIEYFKSQEWGYNSTKGNK